MNCRSYRRSQAARQWPQTAHRQTYRRRQNARLPVCYPRAGRYQRNWIFYNFMIGFDGDLATVQTDSLQQLRHHQGPTKTPVFPVDGQARVVGLLFINFIRVFTALRASDRTILGQLSLASITNR